MSPFGLGEALGEFIEAAGAGQRALGGVIGWRQRPVAAGGVAAPDPSPRVLAPEPVKSAIAGVRAAAGGHLCFPLLAGGASRAAEAAGNGFPWSGGSLISCGGRVVLGLGCGQ